MDSSTQMILIMVTTTVLLPLLVGAGFTWLLTSKEARFSSEIGLAAALITSFCGIMSPSSLWSADAMKWLVWSPIFSVMMIEVASRLKWAQGRAREGYFTLLLLLILSFCAYLLLSPLGGMWREGVNTPLLNEWLISAIFIAYLSLSSILNYAEVRPKITPAHLSGLALTCGIAGPLLGLSGSASLAQWIVAVGLSVAGVGLFALWRGITLSRSTFIMGYLSLSMTILYAHFYLVPSLPIGPAALLLCAPVAVRFYENEDAKPTRHIILTLIFTLVFALPALLMVVVKSEAGEASTADEFGASY